MPALDGLVPARRRRRAADATPKRGARCTQHMPELVPDVGGADASSRAGETSPRACSSLYDPPPLLAGCSQAVIGGDARAQLRLPPGPHRGRRSSPAAITRPVLGMSDCLWGLLDGVNDAGLAVALAFGGRHARGRGFGITLVVRYLLETCDTVEQAVDDARAAPRPRAVQPHARGRARDAATVYRRPGPRRARRRGPRSPPITRSRSTGPSTRARRAASSATPRCATRPPRTRSSSRRCTRPSSRAASARSTPRSYRPRQPRRHLPLAGRALAPVLAAFTPGTRTVRLRERADRHVGAGPR